MLGHIFMIGLLVLTIYNTNRNYNKSRKTTYNVIATSVIIGACIALLILLCYILSQNILLLLKAKT